MLLLRWLAPLALGWALGACSLLAHHYQKPVVSVIGIQWLGGNLMQQNFTLKLNVQNPNDRALPVSNLHADLRLLGDTVASGVSNRAFVIPALGNADFDLEVTAHMAVALLRIAARADARADPIEYDLAGEATVDLPFLGKLPFSQHGAFPAREIFGRR
jgi:LEA14-like dessication related protein